MANQSWDIQDKADLESAVRTLTQYETDELDSDDLDEQIAHGKRLLALRADVSSFYDDRGVAMALAGVVCAHAKGAVENSPVRTENIGPSDTTFRTSDGSSLQFGQYESMVEMGLSESSVTDAGTQELRLTHDWLHD